MIGRHISHFYIIRALGAGGMGNVYEAQDTRLPRSVAVKVLTESLSQDVDAVRRLKREARLASSLNHPNICTILDVDEGDGQAFIAMELLHGRTLKARLGDGPCQLNEIVDVAEQVVDALAAAHEHGIIHRDITPGNVFLTDNGPVKLLDFGLARQFASLSEIGDSDDLTAPGTVTGTIHYMAPERLDPDATVDFRCDLFSMGVILYQMATGARPFDIEPRSSLLAAIRHQPHVPVGQLAPGSGVQLGLIIDKLLAKDPDERYQTARALRDDLALLRPRPEPSAAPAKSARLGFGSVAVLPFDVIGADDAECHAFRDGLVENIGRRLGGLPDLRVAPRTSTRALAGQPVRAIAASLAVDLILEGTVQRVGNRVRVTANLVDAADERALVPTISTERRFDDLLDVQEDIARTVSDELAVSLSRRPDRELTRDPEAAHAFRRAQHHWRSCFVGGWRPALEHFGYALARDPRFAEARVALASAYNFLGFYCLLKPSQAFRVARREAEQALTLNPRLASAHVQLALAKFGGEWDWEGSEDAFKCALTLDPADPLAHVHYSWLLALLGRDDAALAEAEKGHALAPSSRLTASGRAHTLYLSGHYDQSIEICTECLRLDPEYVFAVHLRGLSYLARSDRAHAVADLEAAVTLTNRAPFYLGLLGRCYGVFGMRDGALKLVSELMCQGPDTYVSPQCFVYIYAGLGEPRLALTYQEQAYDDGASPFNYLMPSIRDLYALDPYHKRRLEQMRLVL